MPLSRMVTPYAQTTRRGNARHRLYHAGYKRHSYSRDWQAISTGQFIDVVDSYIRWYNEKRIKISLGSLSPIEYRESLGLTT
ncbi:hypothetical protein BO443_30029 [Burkholderia orbicola]